MQSKVLNDATSRAAAAFADEVAELTAKLKTRAADKIKPGAGSAFTSACGWSTPWAAVEVDPDAGDEYLTEVDAMARAVAAKLVDMIKGAMTASKVKGRGVYLTWTAAPALDVCQTDCGMMLSMSASADYLLS